MLYEMAMFGKIPIVFRAPSYFWAYKIHSHFVYWYFVLFDWSFGQVCTFENWPKSLKCSMCAIPKENSVNNETERFVANTISSPEREIDENCAGNFIISNANKRNLSHRYQLCSNEPINNCDSLQERRLRQYRRQADWQWLNACIGIWTIFF